MTRDEPRLRYVALGDSYTIGTSVAERERWPNQLVALEPRLELVANLAVNGFTSRDVVEVELPQLDIHRPEFVSVLIGVNDVVQGVPPATYRANVEAILDELGARLPMERIFTVSTPDYTVTPQGAAFGDPTRQSAMIARANEALSAACEARDIRFVSEIFEISRRARTDPVLVAADGLHPSGAQYALWVDAIAPVVAELLRP
jgi:lysophospholipase L1-like esterase